MMTGGLKDAEVNDDVQKICNDIKVELQAKTSQPYEVFTAHKVSTQVVAGTNFFIKVDVGDDKFVHIRVFRSLQQKLELTSYQLDKKKDDDLEYF